MLYPYYVTLWGTFGGTMYMMGRLVLVGSLLLLLCSHLGRTNLTQFEAHKKDANTQEQGHKTWFGKD